MLAQILLDFMHGYTITAGFIIAVNRPLTKIMSKQGLAESSLKSTLPLVICIHNVFVECSFALHVRDVT